MYASIKQAVHLGYKLQKLVRLERNNADGQWRSGLHCSGLKGFNKHFDYFFAVTKCHEHPLLETCVYMHCFGKF